MKRLLLACLFLAGRPGLALAVPAAGAAAASAPASAPAPCPTPLRVGFDDAPFPPLLEAAGAPAGTDWNAVVAREAAHRLGCQVLEVRVPARRLQAMVEHGEVDFAFLFGPTPERLRRLRFPLAADGQPDPAYAIVAGRLALFTVRGAQAQVGWDGHAPRPGARIGVVTGTVQAEVARSRGWSVEPIANPVSSVPMLRGHRFDALFMTRESLDDGLFGGADALVELQPEVERVYYYAAASPAMLARDGALTWRYWRTLCEGSRRYFWQGMPACATAR